MSDVNVVLTFHHGVRSFRGIPCVHYMIMRSSFLIHLQPIEYIQNKVDDVYDSQFRGHIMVGIHIREHDEVHDWAIVPPLDTEETTTEESAMNAVNFGTSTRPSDFARVMHGMNTNFAVDVDNKQLLKFYVASNSVHAKEQILGAFTNVVALEAEQSRDSITSIQDALVEMLLLSKASLLLHSFSSTYAIEASMFHTVPIIGILNGMLVHYNSPLLPFCGSALVAAAYGDSSRREIYYETVPDGKGGMVDRVVNSTAIKYEVCKHFHGHWMIQEQVWCMTLP
jgi:hypothetical protein